MWTSYSRNRIISGEGDVVARPNQGGPLRSAVLYVHGAAEVGDGWVKVPARSALISAIADSGFVVTSPDLGGTQTWGNDTAMSAMDAAYSIIQATPGIKKGKVILVCQSMGFLNSILWAKRNPEKVISVVGFIGVVNLSEVHSTPGGYDGLINSAHGGSYSESTHGATRNPLTIARNKLIPPIPIQHWYGLDDLLCKPSATIEFAKLTGALSIPMDGGHEEATLLNVNHRKVIDFMNMVDP